MAYAFDDEDVDLIPVLHLRDVPRVVERIDAHVESGGILRAWNAQFERVIWNLILHRRYGFPLTTRAQWHCTAAEAAAMSLPRSLSVAAEVLGVAEQKDDTGRRLMLQMAKPRRPRKSETFAEGTLLWWDDEDRRQRLYEYCRQDVRTERAVARRVRPLPATERRVYLLDQLANDRGVHLDVELVHAARDVVAVAQAAANAELSRITDGGVSAVSNTRALTVWLQHHDPEIGNVAKDTVRDLLGGDDLEPQVRAALTIRQEAGKSSVSKLNKMLDVVSWGDKLRGLTLYHGAGTGRFTGKLVQPHNFARGNDVKDVQQYIPLVLARDVEALEAHHPPLVILSAMMRSMLTASPGCRLIAADYGQIEARGLAWLAEQDDLVAQFRIGPGRRVYKMMAAELESRKRGSRVAWEEIDEHSEVYVIGKSTILGAGYQLGWKTFQAKAKKDMGVDIPDADAQLAIEVYRERNARIVEFWSAIESAAIRATENAGERVNVGRRDALTFLSTGNNLWMVLPSKRALCYARPKLEHKVKFGRERLVLSFEGMDSYTHKWKRQDAYGGLLTNNAVQGLCRDLMVRASLRVEERGYPYLLSVHDEVICDVPKGHGSVEEFERLMREVPRWAEGLPVVADAWEGERYRK
jgi:DNA polymerase bacteriophage-type